jgi:hypothetical protein
MWDQASAAYAMSYSMNYCVNYDAKYNAGYGVDYSAGASGPGGASSSAYTGGGNVNFATTYDSCVSSAMSVEARWGWVGGASWTGTWGLTESTNLGDAEASTSSSLSWSVCDELALGYHLHYSGSDAVASGIQVVASAETKDAEGSLRSACSGDGFKTAPASSTPAAAPGGECAVNAQCGSSAFCASSHCVSSESAAR